MAAKSAARAAADAAAEEELLAQRPARRGALRLAGAQRSQDVPIAFVHPRANQPRKHFDPDKLEELKATIRARGLLQPVRLRQRSESDYEIVAGERRWRAFKELYEEPASDDHNPAEYARIPAFIVEREGPDAEAKTQIESLLENIAREDLNPAEKADALMALRRETEWSWQKIADEMGLGVAYVQNLAVLTRHQDVQDAVRAGAVQQQHAIVLSRVGDDALRGALLVELPKFDEPTARRVTRHAQDLDPALPAADRVRQATEAVGARPRPPLTRQDRFPMRQGGRTRNVEITRVLLANTALRVVRPRIHEMSEEDYDAMLREACAERGLSVAPAPPAASAGATTQP